MAQIFIERFAQVNIDLLHEQLSAVAGYQACSVYPTGLTVYFGNNADPSALQSVVDAHDGTAFSSQQQQLQILKAEINTLKTQIGDIDNLTATEATTAIKLLYKVLRANQLI